MDMVFKKGALGLLLIAGMANAFAWPGGGQDDAYALQAVQFRPYMQGDSQHRNQQNDGRRGSGGADFAPPQRDVQGRPGAPDAGRQGRMTPDERRALRRQIDEAGQDIYRSKR